MTEAVASGKDTRCLFINNGDDLLTLKKVVSKKSDKDDVEKQKNNKSKERNDSELNGNHNKTDSINFDIDNTSSLEPNLEMDSDTDRNITIDSICTQEDRESEIIDGSNENSIEPECRSDEKHVQEISTKCSNNPYSPTDSLDDNEYTHNLEDDDLELKNKSSTSYFNISPRAPLHSDNELDISIEEDVLQLKANVIINERKRKLEDLQEQKSSSKLLKMLNAVKYPFQKIYIGSSVSENDTNISKAEVAIEDENSTTPEICENSSDNLETGELNKPNITVTEKETETENISQNITNKQKFCRIM